MTHQVHNPPKWLKVAAQPGGVCVCVWGGDSCVMDRPTPEAPLDPGSPAGSVAKLNGGPGLSSACWSRLFGFRFGDEPLPVADSSRSLLAGALLVSPRCSSGAATSGGTLAS